MTEKQVNLNTKYAKGWTARVAVVGGIDELVAGEGIDITQKTISLTHIPGVAGSYTNPTIQVDNYGRIIDVENGVSPEALGAEVVPTAADVETYSGDAVALVALDAGEGRSALYLKNEGGTFDGPAYLTGSAGRNGADGVNGVDGAKGDKGDKGDAGERGPEGPMGQRGLQGETGPKGADGLRGAEGPQGQQGPMGPTGSALVPNDYGTLDEDRVTAIRARPGNYFFLVQDAGDLRENKLTPTGISGDMSRHVIGWNGTFFTDYGPLTGAQGVQGIQGPEGPQGERGPQGVQGIQGPQGPAGQQGERGIAGQNGAQGIQGPAGPAGSGGGGSSGVEYWTSNFRTITSADSGRTIVLRGVLEVSIAGSGWSTDGIFSSVDIALEDSATQSAVVSFGVSGQFTRTIYPGETTRFAGDNVLVVKRAPRCLLTDQTLSGNSKYLNAPNINMANWESLEIELSNIRPSTSNQTLSYQSRQTSAGAWSGQNVGPQQSSTTARMESLIVFRSGLRVGTADSYATGSGHGFQSSFVTGSNDSITDVRFFYGQNNDTVNILAGGRMRVYGRNRLS